MTKIEVRKAADAAVAAHPDGDYRTMTLVALESLGVATHTPQEYERVKSAVKCAVARRNGTASWGGARPGSGRPRKEEEVVSPA